MSKAPEYRKHAQECRELAALMAIEDRRGQLLQMAQVWEQLAADAERTAERRGASRSAD